MKIIEGNLLDLVEQGVFDVIIQGCNTKNVMGSGIARQIKEKYPEVYKADCEANKNGKNYLGNISHARITRDDGTLFLIINAYTQEDFGPPPHRYASYDAISDCFKLINKTFIKEKTRFGYPMIGCGLGGANWNIVSKIIDEELEGRNHTLVVLPQANLGPHNLHGYIKQ